MLGRNVNDFTKTAIYVDLYHGTSINRNESAKYQVVIILSLSNMFIIVINTSSIYASPREKDWIVPRCGAYLRAVVILSECSAYLWAALNQIITTNVIKV